MRATASWTATDQRAPRQRLVQLDEAAVAGAPRARSRTLWAKRKKQNKHCAAHCSLILEPKTKKLLRPALREFKVRTVFASLRDLQRGSVHLNGARMRVTHSCKRGTPVLCRCTELLPSRRPGKGRGRWQGQPVVWMSHCCCVSARVAALVLAPQLWSMLVPVEVNPSLATPRSE